MAIRGLQESTWEAFTNGAMHGKAKFIQCGRLRVAAPQRLNEWWDMPIIRRKKAISAFAIRFLVKTWGNGGQWDSSGLRGELTGHNLQYRSGKARVIEKSAG